MSYRCDECNRDFEKRIGLKRHNMWVHPNRNGAADVAPGVPARTGRGATLETEPLHASEIVSVITHIRVAASLIGGMDKLKTLVEAMV